MRPPLARLGGMGEKAGDDRDKTGMDMRLNAHDNTTRIGAELMYPSRPSRRADHRN